MRSVEVRPQLGLVVVVAVLVFASPARAAPPSVDELVAAEVAKLGVLTGPSDRSAKDASWSTVPRASGDAVGTKGGAALGGELSAPVAELFSILAEVALDRARTNGLATIHARLVKALGEAKLPDALGGKDGALALPATLRVVKSATLDGLFADPTPMVQALQEDLVGALVTGLIPETPPLLGTIRAVARTVVLRWLRTRSFALTDAEAWQLGAAIFEDPVVIEGLSSVADADAKALVVGVVSARVCGRYLHEMKKECDVFEVVRKTRSALKLELTGPHLAIAVDLATRGYLAYSAAEPRARLRASLESAILVITHVAPVDDRPKLERLEKVVLAVFDDNAARVVSEGLGLVSELMGASGKDLGKVSAVITTIAAYARTFDARAIGTEATLADAQRAARQQRKELLENLIDASTVRTNRTGDTVLSLGAAIGFATGYQTVDRGRTGFDGAFSPPQLGLPMGLALQGLPSETVGWHLMLTAVDLGQFLAYDDDGDTPRPRWDTVLAPGLQAALGLAIDGPQNLLLVGLEARVSPHLHSSSDAAAPADGTTIRGGVFVAYFVPFFDMN
ncbi:hypothetical protein L6R52_08720 [Myxococcota bacterium]|nr:hypothetical protein [Myxococcota bacterium]